MPTARGWTVAGIGVALLASGRIFNGQGAEQLGFGLVVLVLLAAAVVLLSRHDLFATRTATPQRVKAGEPVNVSLRVHNRGRRVPSMVLVEDRVPDELSDTPRFTLSGVESGTHRDASYVLHPLRRGRYLIGPTSAAFLDPFGLASMTRQVADPSTLLVHPRVEPLTLPRDLRDHRSDVTAALRQTSVAHGEDFYALREYVEGDDLRRVHWPSTAKRDRYMVRQDEMPWHTQATIILDDRRTAYPSDLFERAVEATASLANLYGRSGFSFRLLCASNPGIGFGRGDHHLTSCLDLLATLSPDGPPQSLLTRLRELEADTRAHAALAVVSGDVGRDEAVSLVRTGRRYGQVSTVIFRPDASDAGPARLLDRSGIRAVRVFPGGSFARAWDGIGSTARGARWGPEPARA